MERFRAFSRRTLEFGDGLNIIRGANEAGKTTIHEALRAVLFAKPNTRAQALLAHRSWDHDSLFVLTLEFEGGGRSYRLTKDFEARRALLEDLDTGEAWRDADTIQEILEERLGLGSENVYTRLAWLNHDEMRRLGDGGRGGGGRTGDELLARLQAAVVGGGGARSTDEVLKLARQRLAELRRGLDRPANNPGPLRRLTDQMAELDRRAADLQGRFQQADLARRAQAEIAAELAAVEKRLPEVQQLLDANRRLRDLEQQRDALAAAYEEERSRLGRARAAVESRDAAVAEVRRLRESHLPSDEEMRRLRSLALRIEALDESVAAQPEAAAAASRSHRRPGGLLRLAGLVAALLGAAGLGAALAGVDLPFPVHPPSLVEPPAMAVLTTAGVLLYWLGVRAGRRRRRPDPLEAIRTQRALAATALEEGLRRWRAPSLEALEAAVNRRVEAEAAVEAAEQRIADILGGQTFEEVDNRIDEIRRDMRDLERQISEHEVYRLEPEAHTAYEREIADLNRRRDDLQRRLREAELDLARADVDPDEQYTLEETREALAGRLRRLEDHAGAVEILVEELEAARSELLAGVGRHIAEAARPFVSALTAGRYAGLIVEEDLSDVSVRPAGGGVASESAAGTDRIGGHDGAGGDDGAGGAGVPGGAGRSGMTGGDDRTGDAGGAPIPWRALSRGTQDQIYFALRLGLLRLVYGDATPPLLLDDPFLTFDDERAAAAMALLQDQAARGQQVILLTYSDRYRGPGRTLLLS